MAMIWEIWKVGVPQKMLQVGFSAILCGHSFKRPYSISDLEWWDIWNLFHQSFRTMFIFLEILIKTTKKALSTSQCRSINFIYMCMPHDCVQPPPASFPDLHPLFAAFSNESGEVLAHNAVCARCSRQMVMVIVCVLLNQLYAQHLMHITAFPWLLDVCGDLPW